MKKENNELVWVVAILILFSSLIALDRQFKKDAEAYQRQIETAIQQLNQ